MDSPPPLVEPQRDDMPAEGEILDECDAIPLLVPELSTLLDKVDLRRVETMTIWPSIIVENDLTSLSVQFSADCKEWMVILPQCKLSTVDILSTGDYTFANLTNLKLHGVSPPWKAAFFSRLRTLSVSDCVGDTPRMDIDGFIDTANTWTLLQELEFRNVFAMILQGASGSQSTKRRATLPKLKRLTIQDRPEHVRPVLSCLKLPVCTFAKVIGDFRHHDSSVSGSSYFYALRDMVPAPPLALASLPFFPMAMDVKATDREVGVAGYKDDKKVNLLVDTEEDSPERAQALFFSGAAHYLSRTFSTLYPEGQAPTRVLRFTGPPRMIGKHTWVEILRAFPHLERLSVLDVDEDPDGTVADELLTALGETVLYEKMRGVCSGLRFLSLRGIQYSEKLVADLCKVLRRRTRELQAEKLNLDLGFVRIRSGQPRTSTRIIRARVRHTLRPVTLTVEVCCPYNSQPVCLP